MFLEIVTPEAVILTSEVESVTVPGINGEFQMLNNHAPIVSILEKGKVRFNGDVSISENVRKLLKKDENGKWTFAVKGGVIEMKDNKVIVLAD